VNAAAGTTLIVMVGDKHAAKDQIEEMKTRDFAEMEIVFKFQALPIAFGDCTHSV
jgi:hypothetical protein